MEITLNSLAWTPEDQLHLADFLVTQTGSRLLPKIAENITPLLESGDTNAVLIRSGKVLGVQDAIRIILTLARPEPLAKTEDSNEYPDPTDDTQWNDGQKIKDE